MDIAIITNADSPLGQGMAAILWGLGFRVHCIGEDFSGFAGENNKFRLHQSARGRLSELHGRLQEILREENGRLDLLLNLTGVPFGDNWETLSVEEIVRRVNGHLLESLIAVKACLAPLLATRGYLLHCRQTSRSSKDDILAASLRQVFEGLFEKYRDGGLRVTRMSVLLEPGAPLNSVLEESVRVWLEKILQGPETAVVSEVEICERVPAVLGKMPDLAANPRDASIPRLPVGDKVTTANEVLIPTEKPRVWVQLAEVEVSPEADPYPPDDAEEDESKAADKSEVNYQAAEKPDSTPKRRRRRRRGKRDRQEQSKEHSKEPQPEAASSQTVDKPEKKPVAKKTPAKKTSAKKVARKRAAPAAKKTTVKELEKKD